MLKKIPHYGPVLIDHIGLPRYWAAAWGLIVGGSLAQSTLKGRLSRIDAFYVHADSDGRHGRLDDALGQLNLPLLEELLESYFISLRNVPEVGATAEEMWRDAVGFTREIAERLSRTPELSLLFAEIGIRLERLDRMYTQLQVSKKIVPRFVRALPASVMSELYADRFFLRTHNIGRHSTSGRPINFELPLADHMRELDAGQHG